MSKQQSPRSIRSRTFRRMLASRDGLLCSICGKPLLGRGLGRSTTIDHRIPKAMGGTNDPENLALAHRVCNEAKGSTLPQQKP